MPMTHDEIIVFLTLAEDHGYTMATHLMRRVVHDYVLGSCEEIADTCERVDYKSYVRIDKKRDIVLHTGHNEIAISSTCNLRFFDPTDILIASLKLRRRTTGERLSKGLLQDLLARLSCSRQR